MTDTPPVQLQNADIPVDFGSIDEAIGEYVKRRDELTEKRRAFEAEEQAIKTYLEKISMWLRDQGDKLGVDSFKSQYGTAYRAIKTHYRVQDWDKFWAWIRDNNFGHCVEKRAAKLACQEIHNETKELPPGLEHFVEVEFDVRRAPKPRVTT